MKNTFIIFVIFVSTNAFALYTGNIVNGCDNPKTFNPIFQINTYTCNNGYFLPADTLECQPCPIDHVCSGGTFNYNPTQSQGIIYSKPITQNTTNSCSVNFGIHFAPIFVPNTVQLSYDNGNGTISSGTCTYDDLITLPETPPTRPGYTFSGWKLQQQNNNN